MLRDLREEVLLVPSGSKIKIVSDPNKNLQEV